MPLVLNTRLGSVPMIPLPSAPPRLSLSTRLQNNFINQRLRNAVCMCRKSSLRGRAEGKGRGLAACACHQNTFAAQFKFVNLNRARAAASRECLKLCYEFYTAWQASNMWKGRYEAERRYISCCLKLPNDWCARSITALPGKLANT